ncbi:MAG: hypothetical protein Q4E57_05120 [Eubacteriales bacterium]|nr:hypothetical protein [Eubacteriales bacterium]
MGFTIDLNLDNLKSMYCPGCGKPLVKMVPSAACTEIRCKCGKSVIIKGQDKMVILALSESA